MKSTSIVPPHLRRDYHLLIKVQKHETTHPTSLEIINQTTLLAQPPGSSIMLGASIHDRVRTDIPILTPFLLLFAVCTISFACQVNKSIISSCLVRTDILFLYLFHYSQTVGGFCWILKKNRSMNSFSNIVGQ